MAANFVIAITVEEKCFEDDVHTLFFLDQLAMHRLSKRDEKKDNKEENQEAELEIDNTAFTESPALFLYSEKLKKSLVRFFFS